MGPRRQRRARGSIEGSDTAVQRRRTTRDESRRHRGTQRGQQIAGASNRLDARMGPRVPNLEIDLALSGTLSFKKSESRTSKGGGVSPQPCGFFAAPIRRRNPSPRLLAERSGVLLDRTVWNPYLDAHRVPALAAITRCPQFCQVAIAEFRPPEHLAHRTRSLEAGLRSLADLFPLKLGERREGSQQDVANEFVVRR